MITVKHTCGHTQESTLIERLAPRAVKLGKTPEQFIKEQIDWLESHPCPECYRNIRGV